MARAPRPGSARTTAAAGGDDDAEVFEIVVRGEVSRLSLDMLGARDEALVRRESLKTYGYKQSLSGAVREMSDEEAAGLDTFVLLWWLARRKAGEDDLRLSAALDAFPNLGELERDPDAIALRLIKPGDDDEEEDASPEASGAASAPPGQPSPTSSGSTPGTSSG